MKFLIVGKDGLMVDVAIRLAREGNEVKWFIADLELRDKVAEGFSGIDKVESIADNLDWADVTIFEGQEFRSLKTWMKTKDYKFIGGDAFFCNLEDNRKDAFNFAESIGLQVPQHWTFDSDNSVDDAIKFIRNHPGRYVLKQHGDLSKSLSYAGKLDDGSDMIAQLENSKKWAINKDKKLEFSLQKYIKGHEVACTAIFNGNDWIRGKNGNPILLINFEHKPLMNDDKGPATGEAGTVLFYTDQVCGFTYEMLKLETQLRSHKVCMVIDINFIVNVDGANFLEFTPRWGYPTIDGMTQLNITSWSEFMTNLALGSNGWLEYDPRLCGIVTIFTDSDSDDRTIIFRKDLNDEGFLKSIHFGSVKRDPKTGTISVVADNTEVLSYPLTLTAVGNNFSELRINLYGDDPSNPKIEDRVIVPKAMYRTDIGSHYLKAKDDLVRWGWMPNPEM